MADTTNQTPNAADQQTGSEHEPAKPAPSPAQERTDWKTQARKWEERAKTNTEKLRNLEHQLEQASESESKLDKAMSRIAALEEHNAKLELAQLKNEVAAENGVDAALLHGATREELTNVAKALLKWKNQETFGAMPAPGSQPEQQPDKQQERQFLRELLNKE